MSLQRLVVILACFALCGAAASAQIVLNAAYPTTAAAVDCNPSPQNSSFLTTALNIWVYVSVSNAAVGDTLEADFVRPDGTVFSSVGTNPLTQSGTQCFNVPLQMSGTTAVNYLGTWTVRGFWDGLPLFTTTFTLSKPTSTGPIGPTGNLLLDPGGDQGAGDPNCGAAPFIQSWSIDNFGVSLCQYGSFEISPASPGPSDRGANYFAGGPNNSLSVLSQHLDISTYAASIDGGFLTYVFSGWLGGLGSKDDNVTAIATFRDASTNMVGIATLGPVLAADRNYVTGLIQKTANGLVPIGARTVDVVLNFTRVSGTYNDAAADSLSLVFGSAGGGGSSTCTYSITPLSNSVAAAGGNGTVAVTAGSGCPWTATTSANWITVTSATSGTGNGSVSYQVAANPSTSLRTGTITIAGQTQTITQAPGCAYTITNVSSNASASGLTGTVLVATASFCSWTSTSSAGWISLASGAAGTGFGGVTYTVAPNTTSAARSGTVTIAGQTLTVSQAAAPGAAPTISSGGVVNAASYMPASLPAGAIAQGSYFSIFGSNLGPASSQAQTSYPLQTTFSGVTVTVTEGTTTVNAYPVFVSATQINAIMPSNAPLGNVQITVTYNGVAGAAATVAIAAGNFGIFSIAGGKGPGIIQNYVSSTQVPLNTPATPATPGQTAILLGTGLGAIAAPDNQTPPIGNVGGSVAILVGGQPATALYSGRMPGVAGVDQINFQLPANAPTGCNVPVQLQTSAGYSNTVTMAISANGQPCSDPQNPFSALSANGGKIGSILLTHADIAAPLLPGQSMLSLLIDLSTATFADSSGMGSLANLFLTAPPQGTCSALSSGIDFASLLGAGTGSPIGTAGRNLDAGPSVMVSGSAGAVALKPLNASVQASPYASTLGGSSTAGLTDLPALLNPGTIQIRGSGGKDVGAFSASVTMGSGVVWSNRSQISEFNRSNPLTVTWTGGATSNLVLIAGTSTNLTNNTSMGFYCLAPAAPGSFTVPVAALANLPPTLGNTNAEGLLMVATIGSGSYPTFQASGLDAGFIFAMNLAESSVEIQ